MLDFERLAQRVREEPRSIVFVAYADGLRKEGRDEEAWEVLIEGMKHHPDLPSARLVVARLHVSNGRSVLAADILGEVVQHDPANDAARVLLVRLLVEQGRLAEARGHVNVLRMSGASDLLSVSPLLVPFLAPSGAPDPFDSPRLADLLLAGSGFGGAMRVWERIAESTDGPGAAERLQDVRRAAGGHVVGWIEALEPRPARALPFRREVEAALAEEAAERPAGAARLSLAAAFWEQAESAEGEPASPDSTVPPPRAVE